MALGNTHLGKVPVISEAQARIQWFHHLADVAHCVDDIVIKEGLYVVGKEGTAPGDRLFFYRRLRQSGEGIPEAFDTITIKSIREYNKMTLSA
jgi:hypothetical protein